MQKYNLSEVVAVISDSRFHIGKVKNMYVDDLGKVKYCVEGAGGGGVSEHQITNDIKQLSIYLDDFAASKLKEFSNAKALAKQA